MYAIAAGDARQTTKKTAAGKELAAWEISSEVYRVPNPDIASQVNTIQKMAQKRALIASTLLAINASEFFTQDIEDMDFIETSFVEVSTQPQNPVSHKKVQPTRKPKTGPLNGFPDSPAKLLEYVNNKIQVPYDNLSHLLNSLKSESGHDDWMWPGQSDSAGWQLAYELAKQHAEAKLGNADQLGFDTPQPSAGAAYAN